MHRASEIQEGEFVVKYCLDPDSQRGRGLVEMQSGDCVLTKAKDDRQDRCTLLKCR